MMQTAVVAGLVAMLSAQTSLVVEAASAALVQVLLFQTAQTEAATAVAEELAMPQTGMVEIQDFAAAQADTLG